MPGDTDNVTSDDRPRDDHPSGQPPFLLLCATSTQQAVGSIRLLGGAVLASDPVRQEELDERLVGHVVAVREHLERLEHRFR